MQSQGPEGWKLSKVFEGRQIKFIKREDLDSI
jgi:hypothetical protein